MTLEQQVTSLEISKRLKELGVKQESLFWWHHERLEDTDEVDSWGENHLGVWQNVVSAFTVAELGEMLPEVIRKDEWLTCEKTIGGVWKISYSYFDGVNRDNFQTADTEADARGKMLIYLLENKLMGL